MHQPLNPCLELSTEEWEDLCRECGGWEWINGEVGREMGKGKGDRDEFGGRWFFLFVISFQAVLGSSFEEGPGAERKRT